MIGADVEELDAVRVERDLFMLADGLAMRWMEYEGTRTPSAREALVASAMARAALAVRGEDAAFDERVRTILSGPALTSDDEALGELVGLLLGRDVAVS